MTAPWIKGHWLGGSLPAFLRAPLEFYTECARKYGNIAFGRFAHFPVCVLSHPRQVAELLVERAEDLEQSRFLTAPLAPLLGEGLLIAGEESHARQRPLVEQAVRGAIAAAWADEVVGAAERVAGSWARGQRRDLYQEMLRIVSEVLAAAVFGADPRAAETSAAVNRAVDLVTDRIQQFPPIPYALPTPGNLEVRRALHVVERALAAAIEKARAESGREKGLLAALVAARGEDGRALADREIRDQVVMIHVAVRQNLAAALTWTFYLLGQHEESYEKVSREVASLAASRRPGIVDAERLVYCHRVVQESLRLYPPVWQVLRRVVRDTHIGAQRIQAGTEVLMSQWVVQRDARVFAEPGKFVPERWENPGEEWPFSYFPFGVGPRACFGERLSFLTVKLVLAALTRKIHLHPVPGPQVTPLPAFALRPKGQLLVEARSSTEDR
jgi:cytochrome P450